MSIAADISPLADLLMGLDDQNEWDIHKAVVDQQLKECRDRIAKMELELNDSKHLCMIKKFEIKTLQAKLELDQEKLLVQYNELQAKVSKMAQEQQKGQNDKRIKQSQNDDQTKAILARIDQLEKQQKQQQMVASSSVANQQPIVALSNATPAVARDNCWDATACHKDLEIIEPECLTVHHEGRGYGWRLPCGGCGLFYFELMVCNINCCVVIGFATKKMPLDGGVGWHSESYGYSSNGYFCLNGSNKSGGMLTFTAEGDVVGCGINLATRQLIFTNNGQRLDATDLFISPSAADGPLFPCISLYCFGDEIHANFGPYFEFDVGTLSDEIMISEFC